MTSNNYRGIDFEAWKDGGFIVDIMGDEIFCETIEDVEKLIDETIEPNENAWWVSFYLQDGTLFGGTYEGDDIDDVERQIMQEYGEMFGGIADYGRYADID